MVLIASIAPAMTIALVSLLLAAAAVDYVKAAPAPALVPRADTRPCRTYISLPGDTCETIAMAFGIPLVDVSGANCTYIFADPFMTRR